MAVSRIISPPRGRLAFPGINPGFDSSHPAAVGISAGRGFSGVAFNGAFVSLLTSARGTNANSPTPLVDAVIGPAINYSGATMQTSFTGQSTTNDTSFTIAAILQFNSVATAQYIFANSSGGSTGVALGIGIAAAGKLDISAFGVGNTVQGVVEVAANTPYFVAASRRGSDGLSNFVAINLLTGILSTNASTTSFTPVAPNGTYIVGNRNTGAASALGKEAAVMFSPSFLHMTTLRQWALDPWSFWYPR